MSDKTPPPAPDYAALAQRYLELWQDQVAKLAKDPQDLATMTQAWSRMAATMNPAGTNPAGMNPGGMNPGGGGFDPGPYRPAPPAAPYGHGGVDRAGGHGGPDANSRLDAIERRLAAIESSLAALAEPKSARPGPASGGRGPRKKP